MHNLETLILSNLLHSKDYLARTIPFLKSEYFEGEPQREIFDLVLEFTDKYKTEPTITALAVDLQSRTDISDEVFKQVGPILTEIVQHGKDDSIVKNVDWNIATAEKWCKDRSIQIAVLDAFNIISGKDKRTPDALPDLLKDALRVSFDTAVGHDYFEHSEERHEYYQKEEHKIPFDIDLLNKITGNGLSNKTITVLVGGTGGGKSLTKCHMASANLVDNKNVLYITMEMSEEKIAERIDANLLDTHIAKLKDLEKESFMGKIAKVAGKTRGRLIVKEYPTGAAHVGHFRALLHELQLKKDFIPDIIYIDYLNICSSSRMKGADGNMYSLVKSIAEELRGLAVEFDLPIVTSTQVNRAGFESSDPGIENTSESFGLAYTADLMLLLIGNEQLDQLNQMMFKQLKNRYNDVNYYKRFVVGIDKPKMRLYDVESSAQDLIADAAAVKSDTDDTPAFDRSKSGGRVAAEKQYGDFKL